MVRNGGFWLDPNIGTMFFNSMKEKKKEKEKKGEPVSARRGCGQSKTSLIG